MSKLILMTAPRDGGKTTALWKLYKNLCEEGYTPGGFITAPPHPELYKKRIFLEDLQGKEQFLLASALPEDEHTGPAYFKLGKHYTFFLESFDRAHRCYEEQIKLSHLFLDEAGRLEFQNRGFAASIDYLSQHYKGTLIIALREGYEEEFLQTFDFDEDWVIQKISLKHD